MQDEYEHQNFWDKDECHAKNGGIKAIIIAPLDMKMSDVNMMLQVGDVMTEGGDSVMFGDIVYKKLKHKNA